LVEGQFGIEIAFLFVAVRRRHNPVIFGWHLLPLQKEPPAGLPCLDNLPRFNIKFNGWHCGSVKAGPGRDNKGWRVENGASGTGRL
jgi:hypothetical protein